MLARVVVVLVGLIVPLLLLEAALRLFGPILPGNYDTGHYLERHPVFGHFNVPGFDGWIKTSEFKTHVQISPLGLRDPRTEYTRPADVYRILVVGDSFVEGVQVNAADTVAARLESSLQAAGGRRVEVLNAGVAGYGTGQEMLLFEQEGLKYDPQLLVLVVFLGNDIGDNAYRPDSRREAPSPRPSFELSGDNGVRVVSGTMPERPRDVRQALRDCCLLYNVFETGVLLKLANGPVRDQPETEQDARYLVRDLYELDPDSETMRGWRVTERVLGRLRDHSAAAQVRFVIVGAPDSLALDEAAWEERMGGSRAASGRFAPDAPNRRLGEIAARLGVPYVDLYPVLSREIQNEMLYYPIDSHWTPAGHALVARTIETKLRELGLVGQ
ncbi:MAG TPA: SGNH/GDSL hydrolase family protein [Chloroflexota bacterium]|nr:SGNH/GDSL hydrolase family protein [Chloroflexota bacterium]